MERTKEHKICRGVLKQLRYMRDNHYTEYNAFALKMGQRKFVELWEALREIEDAAMYTQETEVV